MEAKWERSPVPTFRIATVNSRAVTDSMNHVPTNRKRFMLLPSSLRLNVQRNDDLCRK